MPALAEDALSEDSHVVLITTNHFSDEAALGQAILSQAGCIGMIGSQSKCQASLKHLHAEEVYEQILSRIYAPIGPE